MKIAEIAANWGRVKVSLGAASKRQTVFHVRNPGPRNLWRSMKSLEIYENP